MRRGMLQDIISSWTAAGRSLKRVHSVFIYFTVTAVATNPGCLVNIENRANTVLYGADSLTVHAILLDCVSLMEPH
jgi:hypothetical protein